ncbi:MAG: prepilin-type N-terminal cleavage/methylation domain-containing protein [Verrucomicrobiota bacterium]|nr:prepilin-type N-terminal cleavage/methylation domain-containing protein [Verrucomicrobiota bacterium]
MSTRGNVRGFTLFEMMIAVAIVALMVVSLHQFLVSNLNAIQISSEISAEKQAIVGLTNLLQAELNDLPPRGASLLIGVPHRINNLDCDELQWQCRAGNGLLTTAAPDEDYRVTLTLDLNKSTRQLELGLRRRLLTANERDYNWLPVMRNIAALKIEYFDPRLNYWLPRWNASNAVPSLVRIRLWRDPNDAPYEAVLTVPTANLQQ